VNGDYRGTDCSEKKIEKIALWTGGLVWSAILGLGIYAGHNYTKPVDFIEMNTQAYYHMMPDEPHLSDVRISENGMQDLAKILMGSGDTFPFGIYSIKSEDVIIIYADKEYQGKNTNSRFARETFVPPNGIPDEMDYLRIILLDPSSTNRIEPVLIDIGLDGKLITLNHDAAKEVLSRLGVRNEDNIGDDKLAKKVISSLTEHIKEKGYKERTVGYQSISGSEKEVTQVLLEKHAEEIGRFVDHFNKKGTLDKSSDYFAKGWGFVEQDPQSQSFFAYSPEHNRDYHLTIKKSEYNSKEEIFFIWRKVDENCIPIGPATHDNQGQIYLIQYDNKGSLLLGHSATHANKKPELRHLSMKLVDSDNGNVQLHDYDSKERFPLPDSLRELQEIVEQLNYKK
jgi:hypothetical protein